MWSTSEGEKQALARHVMAYDRPRVLEIGAFQGQTTRVLASAALERRGSVVVIDPMRWAAEVVNNGMVRHLPRWLAPLLARIEPHFQKSYEPAFWRNVGDARSAVELRRALSTDDALLASDELALAAFDVVFIDGDHSYEGALADLRNWGARASVGGVILVHDAVPAFPGVMRALREFAAAEGLEIAWPSEGSLARMQVPHALSPAASAVGVRSDSIETLSEGLVLARS
jgi:hypothetical protein